MLIEETFTVDAPIDVVWKFITDPDKVGPCVPGCEGVEVTGPRTYRATVKVALGPIKTRFNVEVEWTEEEAPVYAASVTRGEEGGRASTLKADSVLRLSPVGNVATEVYYRSEVSIFGRLGKFGLGIMKKKATALGRQFAETFRESVEKSLEPEAAPADRSVRIGNGGR